MGSGTEPSALALRVVSDVVGVRWFAARYGQETIACVRAKSKLSVEVAIGNALRSGAGGRAHGGPVCALPAVPSGFSVRRRRGAPPETGGAAGRAVSP